MITDDLATGLRIYTATVAVLVAILGSTQWRRWRSYMPETQLVWLAVVLLNFSALAGALQALDRHLHGGPANYVIAVAVTFELYAVGFPYVRDLLRRQKTRRFIRNQEEN